MSENVKFSTFLGNIIDIPKWQMSKQKMEEYASEHYGKQIICDPGLVYDGRIAVVWRCCNQEDAKVEGYFYFCNGFFDYPKDFDYPVSVFVPLSSEVALVGEAKVIYNNGILTFLT